MAPSYPVIRARDAIIALNPGHDGTVVVLRDRLLELFSAAEYDSFPRYQSANAYFMLRNLSMIGDVPKIIGMSGWPPGPPYQSADTPYHGVDDALMKCDEISLLGQRTHLFRSTHERSHVYCSYGMSPFPQGKPCYVLVWEGEIGSFYEVSSSLEIRRMPVFSYPGFKYSFLYDLADPQCDAGRWRHDTAGKLMAIAGLASGRPPDMETKAVIQRLLDTVAPPIVDKSQFADTPYLNCGVTDPQFCELAAGFSQALFDVFYSFAKKNLPNGYPLLIAGGCGLNCNWNSMWKECGLFEDVFFPPVPNDAGSAIGTAVEAQYAATGSAKINWSVYSGPNFQMNGGEQGYEPRPLDYQHIASILAKGEVVAWVQGKAEIGPRALGNRSLLAAPFSKKVTEHLNEIKQREWYRPIAPVCLEEDAHSLFGIEGASPFMLYFHKVKVQGLDAVTHFDGSARVQTVSASSNAELHKLLTAFKELSGYGVLCNTSLNRKGCGFFQRSADLFDFARQHSISTVVINATTYQSRTGLAQQRG